MAKLTEECKVAFHYDGKAFREGYDIVIFDTAKGGLEYRQTLKADSKLLKTGFLENKNKLKGIAVSLDENMSLKFSRLIMLTDNQNSFTISCVFYFSVSDSKILASFYENDDPMFKIREETGQILDEAFCIWKNDDLLFAASEAIPPKLDDNTAKRISNFCKKYGIKFISLSLKFILSEEQLRIVNAKKKAKEEEAMLLLRVNQQKLEDMAKHEREIGAAHHGLELQNISLQGKIAQDKFDLSKEVVRGALQNARSTEEMITILKAVTVSGGKQDSVKHANDSPSLTHFDGNYLLLDNKSVNTKGFIGDEFQLIFSKVIPSIESSPVNKLIWQKVISAALHIHAELVMQDQANKASIMENLSILREHAIDAENALTSEFSDYCRQLTERLKEKPFSIRIN